MIEPITLQYLNSGLSLLALGGLLSLRAVEIGDESVHFFSVSLGLGAALIILEAGVRVVLAVPPHLVHAVAAILIVVAFYDPVDNRVRTEEWLDLLLRSIDATEADLTGADRRILEALASAGIVLTPGVVSTNIDEDDEVVGERLDGLSDQRLVARAGREKFHITPLGERLVRRAKDSAQ